MRYPTDNPQVSAPYGPRTNPLTGGSDYHHGVDFIGPAGTPLYAVDDYTVVWAGWRPLGGWTAAIRLPDGVVAWYQHMYAPALVSGSGGEGDQVGVMGNTGAYTTGRHLHFELRRNGVSFDPIPYLNAAAPASGGAAPLPTILPKVRTDMQMYLREEDGTVHFLSPGQGFTFKSVAQYQVNRNQILTYRAAGATDLIVPPSDPMKVPTVNAATMNHFRVNYFGLKAI